LVQRRCTFGHFPAFADRATIGSDLARYALGQSVSQATWRSEMAMGSGRRILVVEDDHGMREAIETLLDAAGFATTSYASAETLLAGCELGDALCIVSDIKLPMMSGIELLTELRARGAKLPVIVITAHDAPHVRQEALRRGAAAYLGKPFAGDALLAAIEGVAGTTTRT
jgi:FixJ family two-component response regulator